MARHAMLLVIDIGNTNVTFGVFDGDRLVEDFRATTLRGRTADEFAVFIHSVLALRGIALSSLTQCVLASVVPPLTATLAKYVSDVLRIPLLVVGPGTRTGMPILYDNPRDVGADRVVNAVAAYERFKSGLIVVDFGTATTFDCVSPKGEYLGGAIVPGIQISAEALFARAARLSRVELALPPHVIGRNPTHSMQSGLVYGYASLVDGMVRRIRAESDFECSVIATGGLARLISKAAETIDLFDDHLTLHGLRIIYERNRKNENG